MPRPLRYWALSAVAAVLYILSFPNFNLSLFAWIALVPLLYAVFSRPPKRAFWLGWGAGTLAYAGLLYWIVVTFQAAGQALPLALLCLLLLSAYLGLFWGLWASVVSRLRLPPVAAAAVWVSLEFLRGLLFSGFPWTLLGDSQWRYLPLIQIASATGVYGVSFLIVLVNATLATLIFNRWPAGQPLPSEQPPASARFTVLLAVAAVAGSIAFGVHRLHEHAAEPAPAFQRVALLQGNIDQYQKWDRAYEEGIKKTYADLIDQAMRDKPALIVWPETSVPGYLLQDPPLRAWLTGVVQHSGTSHIVGAPSQVSSAESYNSAFSLTPRGEIIGQYDKQHLVPFGEVVPWGRFLGRWVRVLNELGGFTAGSRSPVLMSGLGKVGVSVCYEAIFPNLVRNAALQGAGVLVNLTNDGWYMRTAAPVQHFVPNVFRAVENDRWLLRADNTGISAIIGPTGAVQAASPIFVAQVVTGRVAPRQTLTFYTRYGDLFALGCLVFCIRLLLRGILRRRKNT